jgi:glycosyltransferase involved in cell wall biosynthesis
VGGARKAELLSSAGALIFPVLWDEPFGLVVVEALLAGTAVIASRRGSLSELVTEEVGELLPCPDSSAREAQWVESVRAWRPRDPEVCRDWARRRFSVERMAEAYEGAYRKVLGGETLQKEFKR